MESIYFVTPKPRSGERQNFYALVSGGRLTDVEAESDDGLFALRALNERQSEHTVLYPLTVNVSIVEAQRLYGCYLPPQTAT